MIFALACCFFLAAPAETFQLQAGAPVADTAAADLDGDGLDDLVAVTAPGGVREVLVFLNRGDEGFQPSPDARLPLEADAGALFFTRTGPGRPAALAVASHREVAVFEWDSGSLHESTRHDAPSLFPAGARALRFLDWPAVDLHSDDIDTWLIPVPGGMTIYREGLPVAAIACEVAGWAARHGHGGTQVTHRIPGVSHWRSPEGAAFLRFTGERSVTTASGPQWNDIKNWAIPYAFEENRDDSRAPRSVGGISRTPPGGAAHDLQAADVNQDGIPDIVTVETRGGITVDTVIQCFHTRPDGSLPDTPDQVFERKSAHAEPEFADLDSDGHAEMLLVEVDFGMRFVVNYFARGKITLNTTPFMATGGGLQAAPDRSASFTLPASKDGSEWVFALGDFNADGLLDAVFPDGDGKPAVFPGTTGAVFAKSPWLTIEIPANGLAKTANLGGGDGNDLIVFRPQDPEDTALRVVRF
jgi:hypothetical protein